MSITAPGNQKSWDLPFPEPAPTKLQVPPAKEVRLRNGLTIIHIESHQNPFVALRFLACTGAELDTPDKAGLAQMMTSMLTYGTHTRSEKDIQEEADILGGSISAAASRTGMQIYGDVPLLGPETLDRFLALFADLIRNPSFPEDAFEKLRQRRISETRRIKDDNRGLVARAYRRGLYGNGLLARSLRGTPATLANLTRDDLQTFWKTTLVPENAILGVAGAIDHGQLVRWAESVFGDLEWGVNPDGSRICTKDEEHELWKVLQHNGMSYLNPRLHEESCPPHPLNEGLRVLLVERPDPNLSQVHWLLGHHGSIRYQHPLWMDWRLATQILGGDFTARINQTLRVREGLTYGARLSTGHAAFRPGPTTVSTYATPPNLTRAVRLAIDELEKALETPFPEKEIAFFRNKLIQSLPFRFETPMSTLNEHITLHAGQLGPEFLENYASRMHEVTPESIHTVLQEALDPKHLLLAAVAPPGCAEELEELVEERGGTVERMSVDQLVD
jgi:zinc protease